MQIALAALCVVLAPRSGDAGTTATASVSFLHPSRGAVASDSAAASEAGLALLKSGGNAVDAACATALALGVVHPFASGLGGGGFALVYLARSGKAVSLDFRESAPRGLRGRLAGGAAIPPQSGLSIGVPGEPAGLAELVRRYGTLPFSRCVEPALRLARGFPASLFLIRQIEEELARNPASGAGLVAEIFGLPADKVAGLRAGDRLTRPRLARTLERLQAGGPEALYRGEIARAIVAASSAAGGTLALDDLANYSPVDRRPLETRFLGRRVLLPPPPSAGGVILVQTLGIVAERADALARAGDPLSPDYLHLLAEGLKHGFADRARFLGDPDFAPLPLGHLLDPAYHHELAARIRPDGVLPHEAYGTPAARKDGPAADGGTAHVSVVDGSGNAVALTTTVNLAFGARIVAGETGILLNDELDDFSGGAGRPDVFSLTGGDANRAAPGRRPLSSMSPTIVVGGSGVELVTGAAGGPRITSATLQIVLDVLLFGRTARQAVEAPRIHHQWEPDLLFYEPSLPVEVVRALARKRQQAQARPDLGKANAIVRTRSGLDAAAESALGRRGGGLLMLQPSPAFKELRARFLR